MFQARILAIVAMVAAAPVASARAQSNDANFCRQYAVTAATASEDAIRTNPSCRNPGSGVHGDQKSHFEWCMRTPQQGVEGASVNIRRLASRCTSWFVTPEEYGGYAIIGAGMFEEPYGKTHGWEVKAAYSGRLFMYCVASNNAGNRTVMIGVDQAMPGDGRQWQLAAQLPSKKDQPVRLEIDGKEPANRAGADVTGTVAFDWTIAWLNMGHLDALRQGKTAALGVGERRVDFSLDGLASALDMVEECRARKGADSPRADRAGGAPQPAPAASIAAASPGATAGPEPADLVDNIYRSAMEGRDLFDKRNRAQYLSRQLVRLIVQDEQNSTRNSEPGKLDYSLLSGGQDQLKIGDLQVTEISRQQDRVMVGVQFRNIAFKERAPIETVTYQLQSGDQGWRITNIIYGAQHDLLGTLTR